MKTRLRRHTELEREREARDASSEEARSEPLSPQDPAASPEQSSRPRPAGWSVDQVWEFISALPGWFVIFPKFHKIIVSLVVHNKLLTNAFLDHY